MEGFGKKIKNGLMYTAFLTSIGLGKQGLENLSKSSNKNKEVTTIFSSSKDETATTAAITAPDKVYLFEDDDGSYINPREQTESEPEKLWLLNFLKSETYRKKAHAEGLADKDIQERIKRLENTPIFRRDVEHFADGSDGFTSLGVVNNKAMPTISVATVNTELVSSALVHEEEHAATFGDSGLSDHAIELYKESFNANNKHSGDKEYESYLRRYTERDARKRQLEFEAEKLGIIKAGQKITGDDYRKIIDVYNQGKFTYGARQFIETTKPEYFIKVMNEIADNQESLHQNDMAPDNLPLEQQG